ncbi:MAG: hypothetical protein GY701_28905 [Sulfitobacter sp.]|nr:hypothetical protein [Sulfitobacter sp.]
MSFVKLHESILDSSIWSESQPTRLVWITMLAMADGDGVVHASVSGLARRANVSREECQSAIDVFLGPDKESRDGTSGERIEALLGGWLILNHANYRERKTREQELTAERVRKHREKRKALLHKDKECNVTERYSDDVTPGNATSPSEAEAEAEADSEKKKIPKKKTRSRTAPAVLNKPEDVPEDVWKDWLIHRKAKRSTVTKTALMGIKREAGKAGMSLTDALRMSITQGWQGFKADWVKHGQGGPKTPAQDFKDVDYGKNRRL